VDLKAIGRNFARIRKTVRPARVMAVLKANAYGLGAVPVPRPWWPREPIAWVWPR
jgi:alanine racemase